MSQNQPLSDHLSSLTLEPSNTLPKESNSGSSTPEIPRIMEYASEEENAQFHKEFPNVPKEERLVVYLNAQSSSLYVSEKHIYYMIFDEKGSISMDDMIAVYIRQYASNRQAWKLQLITQHTELKILCAQGLTELISNAIHKAFDIICNRWRACLNRAGAPDRDVDLKNTTSVQALCKCSKEGKHSEVSMEGVFLGMPKEMHHLLFMSEFGKSNLCRELGAHQCTDVQISDWAATSLDASQEHLAQTVSYKRLNRNYSIHNKVICYDLNESISVVSTTNDGSITQCTMTESGRSSRFVIT
ncbi:hypothetical protein L218DRAFT_1079927, partial [Marasmius fiardii PR-910]